MVNTRSNTGGAGNNTGNKNPSPPPAPVTMEKMMAIQTQILQGMFQTLTSFQQAQAQQIQTPPWDRYGEFMKGCPPIFDQCSEPIEADDWLKSVERHLEIAQCNDTEKVLYASGQLQGAALDWWGFYTYSHATPANVTWQEFKDSFRSHHMPAGLIKLKKEDFLSLKQGSMSIIGYRDKFIHLSRYASSEVDTDEKKQDHFMEGLDLGLQCLLVAHSFDSFQQLVDKALLVENKLHEIVAKRRMALQSQVDSSSHNYLMTQIGAHYFFPEDQYERPDQAQPYPSTPTYPQEMSNHQSIKAKGACFYCKQKGHFISQCPKKRLHLVKRKAMKKNFVKGHN